MSALCSLAYTHFFWAGHHGPLNENKLMGFMVFSWTKLGHTTWAFIGPIQVQHYKRDGIVPWLADKNLTAIALAMTIDQVAR